MMKLAVPMMIAWFLADVSLPPNRMQLLTSIVMIVVPTLMIVKQPDLGTALLVFAVGFYVIFFAGIGWKVLATLAALALASVAPLWGLLHDYQRRRILTLLDPTQDPLGAGYHIIQSTIAIGAGGLSGKGWLKGTQAHLEFIPERHTDFIFAVYSEEFGLIGNCVLLVLYALLIARGLAIAAQGATLFARLLGGALSLIFFTYAFVNMGMVSGILPVVGVPLPFLSYGGTALLTLFVAIGLLMSIHKHRKLVRT
jgi:rod shape determining protein RodA